MDYKQSNISGTSWVRCRAVTVTNPYSEVDPMSGEPVAPVAYFQEEKVITADSAVTKLDIGSCYKKFNPANSIPLRDPTTGALTGATVTQGELYVILYSLYMQTALERDAANAPAV